MTGSFYLRLFLLALLCQLIYSIKLPSCSLFTIRGAEAARDFYKILGVPKSANKRAITKAYHKKAKILHPDVAPEREAEFIELARAYEVLSDETLRAKYDKHGEDGLNQPEAPKQPAYDFSSIFGSGFASFSSGPNVFKSGGFRFQNNGDFNSRQNNFNNQRQKSTFLYSNNSDVVNLNEEQKQQQFASRSEMYLVHVYDSLSTGNEATKSKFLKLISKFKIVSSLLKIAAIECKTAQTFCNKYKIPASPRILFFSDDVSLPSIENAISALSNPEALIKKISSNMPNAPITLTPQNIKSYISDLDNTVPLFLFFSDDSPISIIAQKYIKGYYKDRIHFVSIPPSTRKKLSQFAQISNFPTVLSVQNYDTLEGEWLIQNEFNLEMAISKIGRVIFQKQTSVGRYGAVTFFRQLTQRMVNVGECGPPDSKFCIILVVYGDKSKSTAMDVVSKVSEKYKNDPVRFVWVQAPKEPQLITDLDLPKTCIDTNCSKLIAYRGKRQKYTIMESSSIDSTASVETFVDSVITGATSLKKKLNKPFTLKN